MNGRWLLCLLAGYLSGSIPFGLLIGLARGVDVRKAGSGNLGTTNVGRVLGRRWGALCFVLDVLKGLLPVVVAGAWLGFFAPNVSSEQAWRWLAVAAASVLGHVFPVWLGFRGGKGVATGLGAVLGFWPALTLPALAAAATWIIVVKLSRYVSLASMLAAVSLPLYTFASAHFTGSIQQASLRPFLVVTSLMAVLVVFRHRTNIARLRNGTESRVGRPKEAGH